MDRPRMALYAVEECLKRQQGSTVLASQIAELRKSLNVVGLGGMLKEGMAEPIVLAKYPELAESFAEGFSTDSVLMMIDLSPFSSLVSGWKPWLIAGFLERYYRTVVTRIAGVGGVVEKYIGDAVLAVFGKPFEKETGPDTLEKVITLARALIKEIHLEFGDEVSAKCAIAAGECFYGYVGPEEHHPELTIIGNPLTEVFRLESKCPERSVILLEDLFRAVQSRFPLTRILGHPCQNGSGRRAC